MFKPVHMLVTVVRSTKIIKTLQHEYNFATQPDEKFIQLVIDFVMLRTLSNEQIVNEIMEMHTINLKDLAHT